MWIALFRDRADQETIVPDDPRKRGPQDRKRVSQQPHEQRYKNERKRRNGGGNASGGQQRRPSGGRSTK